MLCKNVGKVCGAFESMLSQFLLIFYFKIRNPSQSLLTRRYAVGLQRLVGFVLICSMQDLGLIVARHYTGMYIFYV